MRREPHEVLGLPKNATEEEIKRAYKRRASELHPDRVPGKRAEWDELQQAYRLLTKGEEPKRSIESDQFVVNLTAKIEPALQEAIGYGAAYANERLGKMVGGGLLGRWVQVIGKSVIGESQELLREAVAEGVRRARET